MPSCGPFFPVSDQASFNNAQPTRIKNEAQALERSGDLAGADRKHLEALRMKITASGENLIHVGLTKNALDELYLDIGRLDEAKMMLEAAGVFELVSLAF